MAALTSALVALPAAAQDASGGPLEQEEASLEAEADTLAEDERLEAEIEAEETETSLEAEEEHEAERSADRTPGGHDPYRGHVLAELTFFHYQDNTGLSPLFEARYRPTEAFRFDLQWGLSGAVLRLGGQRQSDFSSGNPYVAGYWAHDLGSWPNQMTVFVGGGIAMPAASLPVLSGGITPPPSVETKAVGITYALAARGVRDAWLWVPDTTSVVVTGAFESLLEKVVLETSLDIVTMIPVRDRADVVDPFALIEWTGVVGMQPMPEFEFGVSIATVIVTGDQRIVSGTSQRAQGSADFYAEGRLGGVILALDFLMNVGKPLGEGILARGDSYWGLTFGLGAELP